MAGLTGIAYGADYNPEQWDPSVWRKDVELMRHAGVTLLSVGIFSWSMLEPRDSEYQFGWLDEVLGLLADAGIAVNLANATATPPPWLSAAHPEILPMLADGSRLWPGARQAFCPSSPVFRNHALRLTEAIATRYAGHPALAMWHVSNEIGGHNARCYCDVSAVAFRKWLRDRYDSIGVLNAAWGTTFWGQVYSEWDEILPPRQAASYGNPTHALDFYQFSSDECVAEYVAERDVLRKITPNIPVTTNIMPGHATFDYWSWAPELDVVAIDHYLTAARRDAHIGLSMAADTARGLAGGSPWMLMEQSTSAVNWQARNVAKQPGEMMRNSLQHVARGADSVMFFQWRSSQFGAEKYHSAMVPHAGTDTKIWREVVELGDVLGRLEEVAGTTVTADVALLFDWRSGWALDAPSHPSVDVRYADQVDAMYTALWRCGVTVDLVSPRTELSGYRLLVVPSLYIIDRDLSRRIAEFIATGGNAVVTFMSGIVDERLHLYPGPYPGALRDCLGIAVEEFFPLRAGEQVALDNGYRSSVWSELMHLDGATAVASFVDGPVVGTPAITCHRAGEGRSWYIATRLEQESLDRLIKGVVRELKIKPPIPMAALPSGVEAVRRSGNGKSFLFLINHGDETAHIVAHGNELICDRRLAGLLALRPGACAVVAEEAS